MTRDELIEKYRDINVEHTEWWADTYDFFSSEMSDNYGVTIRNISFSGFWSQGDGASFECSHENVWELLGKMGRQDAYPAWSMLDHSFDITRYHSSYVHSNTMKCAVHPECDCAEVHDVVYEAMTRNYCDQRAKDKERIEVELRDFFRDKADKLYRRLRDEYKYLTSDEAVWDSIEANDLDKDEEKSEDETE